MNPDTVLQELVKVVEAGAFEGTVTLSVQGALVTGRLSSRQTYLNRLRQSLIVWPDPPRAHLDALLTTIEQSVPSDPPEVLHLSDATVNGAKVGWWRGKIRAVDGFSVESFPA